MKRLILFSALTLALSSCQQQPAAQTAASGGTNETVESIMNRRSIRSYQDKQISDAQLDTLLQCAINAPSAMNRQPWELRVVQNPEILKAINEGAAQGKEDARSPFHNAPTLIVIANDTTNHYSAFDCGSLSENIVLSAQSMGIGTCVVGNPIRYINSPEGKEKIVSRLNFSENYNPIVCIAVGYKNESPDAKPRDKAKAKIIK